MIKITDEVREAARRLLAKYNEAEAARVEERYQANLKRAEYYAQQVGRTAKKERCRLDAARELPDDKEKRRRLEAIINGKRKLIDGRWWIEVHGNADRNKLEKIARMADPARNSSEHERAVAARKLAKEKAKRPPGIPPPPPPLPEKLEV